MIAVRANNAADGIRLKAMNMNMRATADRSLLIVTLQLQRYEKELDQLSIVWSSVRKMTTGFSGVFEHQLMPRNMRLTPA